MKARFKAVTREIGSGALLGMNETNAQSTLSETLSGIWDKTHSRFSAGSGEALDFFLQSINSLVVPRRINDWTHFYYS